jgi:hypothetical protein
MPRRTQNRQTRQRPRAGGFGRLPRELEKKLVGYTPRVPDPFPENPYETNRPAA